MHPAALGRRGGTSRRPSATRLIATSHGRPMAIANRWAARFLGPPRDDPELGTPAATRLRGACFVAT